MNWCRVSKPVIESRISSSKRFWHPYHWHIAASSSGTRQQILSYTQKKNNNGADAADGAYRLHSRTLLHSRCRSGLAESQWISIWGASWQIQVLQQQYTRHISMRIKVYNQYNNGKMKCIPMGNE